MTPIKKTRSGLIAAALVALFATTACVPAAYADPPHWAPAHGYNDGYRDGRGYWHDHGRNRHFHKRWKKNHHQYRPGYSYNPAPYNNYAPAPYTGGYTNQPMTNGTLFGGLVGGALGAATGNQIGKGDGRTAAIIGGAVLGALIGGNVGQDLERNRRY